MNIGFDAKRAFLNSSGLGNYSRSLIKSLVHNYPSEQYHLFTTQNTGSLFSEFISNCKQTRVHTPEKFLHKKIPAIWRSFEITNLLNEQKLDVFHGLSNELPFTIRHFKGKKIVTIHDLIFKRFPEMYSYLDTEIYDRKFKMACQAADLIVAVSNQTKQDIMRFYQVSEKKIKVVYQSCDEIFYREPSYSEIEAVRSKFKLPARFILSVGTVEERKNLLTTLKALELIKDMHLVVVGKKRKYFKTVEEFILKQKLENRVIFLENVATTELPAFYKMAQVFVYPSLFEGFGIPILEAITCKTPVIASTTSSLGEAGGSGAMYINPSDFRQLAELINGLVSNEITRNRMIEKGYEHAQKFFPDVIAKSMMEVYTG
jgi:glycosyltransferase involved in cell wall biosynthesis